MNNNQQKCCCKQYQSLKEDKKKTNWILLVVHIQTLIQTLGLETHFDNKLIHFYR